MAEKELRPDAPSSVYLAMIAEWQLIRDIRAGATFIRAKGEEYLPKFADEESDEYEARRKVSPWTALYEDATRTLCAKPFSKEVKLQGEVPPELSEWTENIDLSGNNLHVYASNTFAEAIHMGGCYILVDMPRPAQAPTNLAQERAAGLRPFFRNIAFDDMLAIYDGTRNGKTFIRQIRFRDNSLELDDMEEKLVERVRVIDDLGEGDTPWLEQRVYEKGEQGWFLNADLSGTIGSTLVTEIPLVAVIFGLETNGRFGVKPTMADLAHKQIEHYRHLARIDQTMDFTGYPLLQAKGMSLPTEIVDGVPVQVRLAIGPRTILAAPPGQAGDRPEWDYLKTDAQGIEQMREHKKDIESEIKQLGLQPSMPQSGIQNMAATTSSINAARTHSAVQAWAIKLKDALELAFVWAARWRGLPETAECYVHTDFSAEVLKDADEKLLLEMVLAGLITRETFYDEMQRRDILGPQFDKSTEPDKLELEGLGLGQDGKPDANDGGATEGEQISGGGGA